MTDFDLFVRDALDPLVPMPACRPDWGDVLRRATAARHRRLLVAFAAALVVLACAATVTAALGGFHAWLSGSPGKPAPAAEQEKFAAANGHSWAAFPTGTKLRQLIDTSVGGKRYTLFGFRSGKTLCLKLKAVSLGHSVQACAPASTLAHITAPILPVDDWTFEDRFAHPSAQVSFGIAADGVSHVEVHTTDGTQPAVVGGNGFLFVENEPNSGNTIEAISALGAGGHRTTITFPPLYGGGFFGLMAAATAPGPRHVQAQIRHPSIGWLVRGEKRGYTPPGQPDLHLVKPDPLSDLVVGISGLYCLEMAIGPAQQGESCGDAKSFFAQGPLNVNLQQEGNTRFLEFGGAAADGVARVELFLADGEQQRVPLVDNLFAALVPVSAFPARAVAYNARGQIVGVQTFANVFRGAPAAALAGLRSIGHLTGPNGARATIALGPSRRRFRCWRISFSTGQRPAGCFPTYPTGPWTAVDLVQPAGRDLFIIGTTREPVVRVELRFANGDTTGARLRQHLFVLAIPRNHLSNHRQFAYVIGLDSLGLPVQRQGVLFRRTR